MQGLSALSDEDTVAELLRQLGGIAPRRILLKPPPGRATERDLIRVNEHRSRLCELVDGVLVEKSMGYPESSLTMWIGFLLQSFLEQHDLGLLAGPDGGMRLMPRLIRLPDISFVRWDRLPLRDQLTANPIADLAPDLAIEVLSEGNTRQEMERKLKEYFLAGVLIVWIVDPRRRTVTVYTAPDVSRELQEDDSLDGGDVLPGLVLPVSRIFARLPHDTGSKSGKKGNSSRRKPGR